MGRNGPIGAFRFCGNRSNSGAKRELVNKRLDPFGLSLAIPLVTVTRAEELKAQIIDPLLAGIQEEHG